MCDYGYNIHIGENFYANHGLLILDAARVEIGDNVYIAPNCNIYTASHPLNIEERNKGLEYAYPVKIGNNVWIGGNVTILPGVTIGDNTTIGAGSVVTKDIPANVVAYGNPCRVAKKIWNVDGKDKFVKWTKNKWTYEGDRKMQDLTLILEGGALRGVYTAGVLDVLLKHNIEANYVLGVSAGALNGMNYISKQPKRSMQINIDYCDNPRYIGYKALRKEGGIIGYDYLFNEISVRENIFDYDTFASSKQKFISVVTNCEKAETEYIEKSECGNDIYKVVQASSSMPLCSKMVKIGENHYLDGAVTMAIPVDWAIKQGHKNILVVLTRDREYRKPEVSNTMKRVYKRVYKKYPKLIDKLCTMPERYNKLKVHINELEKQGRIIVVAPKKQVTVSRLEKDKEKLRALYRDGRNDMEEKLEKELQFWRC